MKKRYRVERLLASGGQCRVFIAHDEHRDEAPVIVKTLVARTRDAQAQREDLALFQQEARILSAVRHVCLPGFVDAFEDDGAHYVVEERVGDLDLAALMRQRKCGLEEQEAAWVGHCLLDLLTVLHARQPGVLLRDIKPGNITCDLDDDGLLRRDRPVWFIDLTIAQDYRPGQDDAMRLGTPGFSPPEQYRGRTQPCSDLYALGVTLFALLSGYDPVRSPFRLPPLGSLRQDVSPRWVGFFERACALEPARRFATAAEMHEALERVVSRVACVAALRRPRRSRRHGAGGLSSRQVAFIAAGTAIAALAAVLLMLG